MDRRSTIFSPTRRSSPATGSGREAKGTQEELLLWYNGTENDMIWEMQFKTPELPSPVTCR